jgi:hypothetical protein
LLQQSALRDTISTAVTGGAYVQLTTILHFMTVFILLLAAIFNICDVLGTHLQIEILDGEETPCEEQ